MQDKRESECIHNNICNITWCQGVIQILDQRNGMSDCIYLQIPIADMIFHITSSYSHLVIILVSHEHQIEM